MDEHNQKASNFFEALNSMDFRAELADAFGFPALKKVDCNDDVCEFISRLEKCIEDKNFSLTRLEFEFSFAQKLLDRAESRYERSLSKVTNLLGFSAAILTIMLTSFLSFYERFGVDRNVFVMELIGLAIIVYVIVKLMILIYPTYGYEFRNVFEDITKVKKTEEKSLLLQKAIANFRIAAGIRDKMNERFALAIRSISKQIGISLLMLLIAFLFENKEYFLKIGSILLSAMPML